MTEIQNKYRKGHSAMFWKKSPFGIDLVATLVMLKVKIDSGVFLQRNNSPELLVLSVCVHPF